MAYFFLGCVVILYVLQNFFCSRYAKVTRSSPSVSSFVYTVLVSIILSIATLILTLVRNGGTFSATPTTLIFAIFAATSLVVYYFSLMGATRTGSYVFMMISLLFGAIIIPAIVDCIITRSFLSLSQTLGVLIMLVAVILFNLDFKSLFAKKQKTENDSSESKGKTHTPKIYYFYCLLLFISNGVYSSMIASQQRLENNLHGQEMVTITYLISAVACFVIILFSKKRKSIKEEFTIGKTATVHLAIAAAVSTAALNVTIFVLGKLNPTVVYTVNNGGNMFLSALISYIVLKEKYELNKVFATVLVITSIIILCVF